MAVAVMIFQHEILTKDHVSLCDIFNFIQTDIAPVSVDKHILVIKLVVNKIALPTFLRIFLTFIPEYQS